ncbi:MAG TPA: LysR substrate-binding domain-containing protein [Noviherbaspirillum sp.]|nr:LysR substrate-binding domain-containing protein [Noviherbaspirillum sp.]
MKIHQLRYFAEIARSGSFSRAAQTLAIAQPALSQNIAALESELKTKLFDRHAKGVELSPSGRRLYERAIALLDAFDSLKEDVSDAPARPSGRVRICIAGSLASVVTAPLLSVMLARFPDIDLKISAGMSSDARAQLESGRIHLALMPSAHELDAMTALPLFEEHLKLFGAPCDIARLPEDMSFSALADLPLALPDRAHDLRRIVERAASTLNLSLDVRYELNSPAMLTAVAQSGLACAIMPPSACVDALAAGTLAGRAIVAPELTRVQAVVWPDEHPLSGAAICVRDVICEVVKTLAEAGQLHGRILAPGGAC